MTKLRIALIAFLVVLVTAPTAVVVAVSSSGAGASITPLLPDLRALTPTDKMYITDPAGGPKLLNYTHIIYNAGPGPLELIPTYDPATDTADATQRLYGLDASGNLVPAADVPIQGKFFWHAPHHHYHFPAADFGLYAIGSDGSVGAAVAMSPKLGFCIADSHEIDPTVARFSATKVYNGGNCQDPTATVGISPGWGDEYIPADIGQSIDISTVPDGVYWFETRVDPNNYINDLDRSNNNSLVKLRIQGDTLTVESPLAPATPLGVDRQWSTHANSTVTAGPVSTTTANSLVVAFVTSDGPRTGSQSATVSGGGLTWTRVRRANAQRGDAEVWQAMAATPLAGATITSTPAVSGFDQSLVIETFHGASGVGASNAASAPGGTPSVSVTTTASGSFVFGAGMDWDHSIYRTPVTGETLDDQWIDETAPDYTNGDTFWVQSTAAPVPAVGGSVAIADSAPVGDQWNAVAVEILSAAPALDTTPPVLSGITATGLTPTGAAIGWTTDEPATGLVNYGTSATYGSSSTNNLTLSTSHTQGLLGLLPSTTYHYQVVSTDGSGNTAISADATFTTPALPPPLLTIDKTIIVQGHGANTTPQFSTALPGELLVAFVASDGSSVAPQNVTLSGGGLTWTRARQSHGQPGDAEVWTAFAPTVANNITVTATSSTCCFDNLLTVIAVQGAGGIGATGIGTGTGGTVPGATLTATKTGSWVFGVALDWDIAAARTPGVVQTIVRQWVDPGAGDTLWVQRLTPKTTAGTPVSLRDPSPTSGRWNYAVVEITQAP